MPSDPQTSTGTTVVTVHLHTILQRPSPQGPQRQFTIQLEVGTTVSGLMADLEITLPVEAMLLVVNGRLADPDTVLRTGDEVHFMPAISGGSEEIMHYADVH